MAFLLFPGQGALPVAGCNAVPSCPTACSCLQDAQRSLDFVTPVLTKLRQSTLRAFWEAVSDVRGNGKVRVADKAGSLFVAMDKDDCDSCGIWLQRHYSLLIAALSEENVWFDLQLMKRSHEPSMVGSFPNTIDGNGCNVGLPVNRPLSQLNSRQI